MAGAVDLSRFRSLTSLCESQCARGAPLSHIFFSLASETQISALQVPPMIMNWCGRPLSSPPS